MEEQILKIIEKHVNNDICPRGNRAVLSMSITSHVMEFIEWEHLNTAYSGKDWFLISGDNKGRTLKKVYQYWLKEVKDK